MYSRRRHCFVVCSLDKLCQSTTWCHRGDPITRRISAATCPRQRLTMSSMAANNQRPGSRSTKNDYVSRASTQTALRKIPGVLPPLLALLLLLRRRSPHQLLADHCAVIPVGVVRVRLGIDRHSAVARHRPCRPAPSAGTSIHGFAVGSHRRVPEEDVLVGDGVALGDAVAFAVGDGAVEGVWVGV